VSVYAAVRGQSELRRRVALLGAVPISTPPAKGIHLSHLSTLPSLRTVQTPRACRQAPASPDAGLAGGSGPEQDAARSGADLCREAPSTDRFGTLRASSNPDDTRRKDVSCHTVDSGSRCGAPGGVARAAPGIKNPRRRRRNVKCADREGC